jgi:hypothetical protein
MVEKITRLTKLARLKEVNDENNANSGPSAFSPGTRAVGGKKLNTDGALNRSSFISADPMAELLTLSEFKIPSLFALKARKILVMNCTGSRSLP